MTYFKATLIFVPSRELCVDLLNDATNTIIFTIFFTIIELVSFYSFSSKSILTSFFLLTNNNLSHRQL